MNKLYNKLRIQFLKDDLVESIHEKWYYIIMIKKLD